MIIVHLDSSESERCAVMQIKLFQNFWIRNESLQGLAGKQVVTDS